MTRQMPRFLRILGALAIVVGVSVVPLAQVAACSCMEMVPAEAARMADAVFTGTPVSEQPGPPNPDAPMPAGPSGPVLYTFAVDGVAKGDVGAEATILGGGDSAMCGMTFATNERWLIFATLQEGALGTSLCAGNLLLQPGEEPPIPVTTPTASEPTAPGAGVPVGIILPVAAVVALAGVAGFLFWRADR